MANSPSVTYSEEQLHYFLKKKDQNVFNYLYTNYAAGLYSVINRIVADTHTSEDILQEVFIKIWNCIGQYDEKKGRLFTWMMRIARNAALDSKRTTGEIMKKKLSDISEVYFKPAHTSTDGIGLRKLISKLRPECQHVIEMIYYNGYTIVDTGKALSMPEGTVKTHLRRAMAILENGFRLLCITVGNNSIR